MGDSVDFPTSRDATSTTAGVADLIDALTFPNIEPLAADIAALSGLPPLPLPGCETSRPASQLDGVRALMDGCGAAIASLRRHQNQCAAVVAVMVERLESTAVLEGALLSLDWWQKRGAIDQICAELACLLHVSEGVAGRLIEQSVTLVRHLPATMAVLTVGELGWDHAVVISEEASLLRSAGIAQGTIDAFEQRLLGHAANKTLPSFRSTARRLRERQYPETIAARTRRAFADRSMRVSRGLDGMSWLSLYAPSPTIEAIWDQCTYTAQAARGVHEDRTLAQLRADIASALLLRQSMDENSIHGPAPEDIQLPDDAAGSSYGGSDVGNSSIDGGASTSRAASSAQAPAEWSGVDCPWYLQPEPDPCGEGAYPDPDRLGSVLLPWQVPLFDDPDYCDPAFREPDPRNLPDWHRSAKLPALKQEGAASAEGIGPRAGAGAEGGSEPGSPGPPGSPRSGGVDGPIWPPLPQVTPVVLIPVLSMLGVTNEPAWMEGAGPISMEVAKRMAAQGSSVLRVLVDPITNKPLDIAPERYRINEAMRTMLRIRDEYCQFPGCLAKAANCEVDHVKSYESGGRSIYNNLESLCTHHHLIKHFKDDKDRRGKLRCLNEPERQGLRLRGWTPHLEEDGRIAWTSPSGRYCPPDLEEHQAPAYPKWLKKLIARAVAEQGFYDSRPDTEALEVMATAAADEETWVGDGLSTQPEEPPFNEEDNEILTQLAIEHALRNPTLGLAA